MLRSIDSLGGSKECIANEVWDEYNWASGLKKEQQILVSKFYRNNFIVKAYKPYKIAKGKISGTWY